MSVFRLSKNSALKNTSDIDAVFKSGQKISSELISLYYVGSNSKELKIAFSVGKKSHSLASTRNKLKRLMKESFRLNVNNYLNSDLKFSLVFVYFSSKEEPYKSVEDSIKFLLLSFKNKLPS